MANCKSISLLVLIFLGSTAAGSAQDRYVIYFKDKNSSPYTVQQPEKFLTQRSISRRLKQDIEISESDLPVSPTYVAQLRGAGVKVNFTSRWLNCALVETTEDVLKGLSFPFLWKYELAAPGLRTSVSGRVKSPKSRKQSGIAEATKQQLEMVGIDDMHSDNIYGNGVLVAILDSGYPGVDQAQPFRHLFNDGQIKDVYDFVENTKNVYRYDEHGTEVFSVIAANSANFTGGAYEASFLLYVTEDVPTEYRVEEYNWLFAAERADSLGVDIIQTSLGYNTDFDDRSMDYDKATDLNGKAAIISKAAAAALERGIVVVCSAGNEGNNSWKLITPPADVDGVVAVGSVTSEGARSAFSSIGPTSDGRVKPDVVAMGTGVSVVRPNGTNGYASGTSLAAPIVTSLLIGLVQKYPDIDPNVIAETMIATATQAEHPDNFLGHGLPNYNEVKVALEGMVPTEEIAIYPNPTDTGKFSVRFKQPGIQATITVYDLNGKELSSNVIDITSDNNPVEISIAELPPSAYLVKVKTSDNFKAFRLVKL